MKMILPITTPNGGLDGIAAAALRAEQAGYEGVSISEINNDPMLQVTVAASSTTQACLMTNIVVAFARSPMTLATQATAVHEYSGGRLILGLGSQIKPHIEKRFSMPWSSPADRMAEYVSALHAIWHAWATADKLDFRGQFYTHTLMIPEYAPAVEFPWPEVFVAAVGERMTEVAGATADGLILHPFTTPRFLHEVTIPALRRGRHKGGRSEAAVQIAGSPFVISGQTDEEIARAREKVRLRIAFYGSTPAYRPVLALHGWEELGEELNAMSKTSDPQRWQRMGEIVPDHVVHTFAPEGRPDQVAGEVVRRFGSDISHLSINSNGVEDPDTLFEVMSEIRASHAQMYQGERS